MNTIQTHFSVLQQPLLSAWQTNSPATFFCWYFHSSSFLRAHALAWSETTCQPRSSDTSFTCSWKFLFLFCFYCALVLCIVMGLVPQSGKVAHKRVHHKYYNCLHINHALFWLNCQNPTWCDVSNPARVFFNNHTKWTRLQQAKKHYTTGTFKMSDATVT